MQFTVETAGSSISKQAHTPILEATVPLTFGLYQNYPNPFNPVTSVRFDLPEAASVTMKVFNVFGQEVLASMNNQQMQEGQHAIQIDGGNLASGTYFYRVTANGNTGQVYQSVKRMILLK